MKQNDLILVIDLQNVYQPGQPWGCPSFPRSWKNIKALLDAAGASEASPMVYLTQFMENPEAGGMWAEYNKLNRDINADPWMSELIDELKPYVEAFPVYQKSTYSSMLIPEVRAAARTAGRIVVTGVVSECCVLATCMEAIDMGCHVVFLPDACSGVDSFTEEAVLRVLDGLSPPHVNILNTADYLYENA